MGVASMASEASSDLHERARFRGASWSSARGRFVVVPATMPMMHNSTG
jgi:hypothetical protein